MNRIQTACYCLIASAVVLGALVMVQGSKFVNNTAQAEMVVNKDFTTVLSAQFRTDSEIIYVLDSKQAVLQAYIMDNNRNQIERLGAMDVAAMFERWAKRGGGLQRGGGNNRQAR